MIILHSWPLQFHLLANLPRGVRHVPMLSGHPWARGRSQPNQISPVFWENVIFSAQGDPRKSWETYFHVKSKNNEGLLSKLFSILAIKVHFLPIYCYFLPPYHFKWKMAKNAFKWPKSKKVQKADPNYFLILHENMSPDFFWGPPGLRKWHYP